MNASRVDWVLILVLAAGCELKEAMAPAGTASESPSSGVATGSASRAPVTVDSRQPAELVSAMPASAPSVEPPQLNALAPGTSAVDTAEPTPRAGATAPQAKHALCLFTRPFLLEELHRIEETLRGGRQVVVQQCGDFDAVAICDSSGRTCETGYIAVFRRIGSNKREPLWDSLTNGKPIGARTFSFAQLSCMGFKLEKTCGDRARFRQTQGGCRPALDVTFEREDHVLVDRFHLAWSPPPLECKSKPSDPPTRERSK